MKLYHIPLIALLSLLYCGRANGQIVLSYQDSSVLIKFPHGYLIKDGLLESTRLKATVYAKAPGNSDSKDSLLIDTAHTRIILKSLLFDKLQSSLQKTIDSLDNRHSYLSTIYRAIFGKDYLTKRNELDQIKSYLKDPQHSVPAGDADIKAINDAISKIKLRYYVQGKLNARKGFYEYDIYRDDPLKLFIQFYLKDCADFFKSERSKDSFDDDRKALEKNLADVSSFGDPLQCAPSARAEQDKPYKLSSYITGNALWQAYMGDDAAACRMQLFWLSDGNFRLLPFSPAVNYDWNKVFRFDKLLAEKVDSLKKCCIDDPAKLEAMIKALNSGRKRFVTNKGYLFGYKDAGEFLNTKAFVNQVLLPVKLKENCGVPGYADPYRKKWVINYNSAKDYVTDNPCIRAAVPEDEQVIVAVNNVSSAKALIITGTEADIKDQSKAQAVLADIGTSLGSAATSIPPLAASFTVAHSPAPGAVITPSEPGLIGAKNTFGEIVNFYLTINQTRLPFPASAGRHSAILLAYLNAQQPEYSAMVKEVDYFTNHCDQVSIDGFHLQQTLKDIDKLKAAFDDFVNYNASLADLKQQAVILGALLPALEDVPMVKPDPSRLAKDPMYRTVLSTFDLVKAPKEKDYLITEEVPKPVKPGVKPADNPGPADSVKTNVMKGFYKVGKRYLIQVSAGIGVTTHPYVQNQPSFSNNTLAVDEKDQQIHLVVGINIYPWKAFNLDNNFMGIKTKRVLTSRWQNRLSIFTGVGFPDPSRNFYLGISDDLLPGLKLSGGAHILRYTKYEVFNDAIPDQTDGIKIAGPYVALNLDVDFVGKLFSLFK